MLLRSPADIRVTSYPRFWMAQRSLCSGRLPRRVRAPGLAWILSLRRRVQKQTAQIRAQVEKNAAMEAELQKAARLEALGRLAGGIAHGYNNLLTVILGNLSLIKLNPFVMEAEADQVLEIEKGALHARDLTRRLLTFSVGENRSEPPRIFPPSCRRPPKRLRQPRTYTSSSPSLRASWPRSWMPTRSRRPCRAWSKSAVHATPAGGTVRIALSNEEMAAGFHGLVPGPYLKLSINDAGEATTPGELARVFEPFFESKRTGGMDLAVAYSIIRKHRGHIEIHSTAGQGTTFLLWLPAVPVKPAAEAPAAVAPKTTPPPDASCPRVLLMDDEESVRRIGSIVLRRLGFEPTTVPDGDSALREYKAALDRGLPYSLDPRPHRPRRDGRPGDDPRSQGEGRKNPGHRVQRLLE